MSQVSASHNLVCQLNKNTHLYCATSPNPQVGAIKWFDAGVTNYRQIALSAGTKLWAIDLNNNLFEIPNYVDLVDAVPVASGVQQVAADGKGLLCETDFYNNVWCSGWPAVPALANTWGYYHSLSTWFKTNAQLSNITVADGKVWGTCASGDVWLLPDYTNPSTWEKIAYGGVGDKLAAASVPSTFSPTDFAPGDVAVLLFMGQSNASGINLLPQRFIAPLSPNVWGITNEGWNFLPSNGNGTTPFTGSIATISSVQWKQLVGFTNRLRYESRVQHKHQRQRRQLRPPISGKP